jgi:uncharacterized membrane protein
LHTAINVPELGQDQAIAVKFIFNRLKSATTMPPIYPRFNQRQPETKERIVSSLCYLSMGFIGLLYIIFSGRNSQSPFFRFNFLQSIILGIFSCLLSWTEQAVFSILNGIFGLAGSNVLPMLMSGIVLIAGLIAKFAYLLMLYGFIWAILGKQAEIPFLSNIVRQQMR